MIEMTNYDTIEEFRLDNDQNLLVYKFKRFINKSKINYEHKEYERGYHKLYILDRDDKPILEINFYKSFDKCFEINHESKIPIITIDLNQANTLAKIKDMVLVQLLTLLMEASK